MKLTGIAFNASQIQPSDGGGSQFTVGKHPVRIIKQEIKPTSNNEGGMLVITVQAFDGPCAGMTMNDRLNVYNNNPTTVKIALERLSAYCHVCGRPDFDANNNDLDELCGIDFMVEVTPQANEPKYNEIKKLFTIDGRAPSEVAQVGGQPQQQQPAQSAWAGNNAQQQQPAAQQEAAPVQAKPTWGQQSAPANTSNAQNWTQNQQPAPAAGGAKKPWEK